MRTAESPAEPTEPSINLMRQITRRVLKVPGKYREFTVNAAGAARGFGIGDNLLDGLLTLGLPYETRGAALFFDILDLENLAVGLRTRSLYWHALKMWGSVLRDRRTPWASTCEVELTWTCPQPGHAGDCSFTPVADPLRDSEVQAVITSGEGALRLHARLSQDDTEFGDLLSPVVDRAVELDFHRLPWPLADDPAFAEATGLADCRLATRHLLRVAEAAGLTVRPAAGFFMGIPYPTPHSWLEVRTKGGWRSADPFFLHTLQVWGLADPAQWPVHRSPCDLLWRTSDRFAESLPLIMHGEAVAAVKVKVRRTPRAQTAEPVRAQSESLLRGSASAP